MRQPCDCNASALHIWKIYKEGTIDLHTGWKPIKQKQIRQNCWQIFNPTGTRLLL